jgi:hypothetical protein
MIQLPMYLEYFHIPYQSLSRFYRDFSSGIQSFIIFSILIINREIIFLPELCLISSGNESNRNPELYLASVFLL